MTLHVVLGEGSINKRELEHQLNDLWEKAEGEDDDFWFVVQGKAQPTQADKDLVEFFTTNQLHYQVVVPEGVTQEAGLYDGAAAVHETEGDFTESVVELLMTLPENGEGADVLALFVNVADDVDEDAELIAHVQAAMDAGFKVFGLNDAMEQVKIEEEEAAPPPAPEPEPAPPAEPPAKPVPAKKASKKAAAAAAASATEPERYTRVELDGMTPAEVKALASGMGIKMKTKKEQVEAILAAQSGMPVPDPNGQFALVDGETLPEAPAPTSPVVTGTTSNPAMATTTVSTSGAGYIYTNAPVVPVRGDALAEMALIVVHWGDSTITVKHLPAGLVEAFLAQ